MPSESVVSNVGELIRNIRKEQKLSQEVVAYRAGVEQTAVSKFERGVEVPSADRARRLAKALGLDSEAFITRE